MKNGITKTLTIFCLWCTLSKNAYAQDAAAIVSRMELTYKNLNSYAQKMSATQNITVEGRMKSVGLVSELRYSKPNLIYSSVSNAAVGSIVIWSDGKTQTGYRSKSDTYQQVPAPPNLDVFVNGIRKFGIIAMLDPLYFLSGSRSDKYSEPFRYVRRETVNGTTCEVVSSALKRNSFNSANKSSVTFWIDQKSGLLQKIETVFIGTPVTVPVKSNSAGKRGVQSRIVMMNQTITQVVQESSINPALSTQHFTYRLPKSATLVGAAGTKK